MTTKPKPRKSPAVKATPKPPKEANGEPKREVSEIGRLVARWHWLLADQQNRADCAKTDEDNERLIAIHNDEIKEVEDKLASLVPEKVYEACTLLKFVADVLDSGMDNDDGAIVSMLRNIDGGLRSAFRDEDTATREELKAERAKGFAEGRDYCRQIFTTADVIMEHRRHTNTETLGLWYGQ